MQVIQERENQNSVDSMQGFGKYSEKKSMHPDDFKAHLAWVTAKRFHELVLEKTFAEMPVYYRFPG